MINYFIDEITLKFEGYRNVDGFLPSEAGIYCIYRAELCDKKSVNLFELLYIGEAEDIKRRFSHHEHRDDWDKRLYLGEFLVYSFTPIDEEYNRKRAEAAMIYAHKRKYHRLINTSGTDSFNYGCLTIRTEGSNGLLYKQFTIYEYGNGQASVRNIIDS